MRTSSTKPLAATSVATLLLLSGAAWAQSPSDGNRYTWGRHMMGWDGSWYAMIFGPLFMIILLAVLIAAVVFLARWLGGPWHGTTLPHHNLPNRTPIDILKERFARGEIDKDEYEERRRVLGE